MRGGFGRNFAFLSFQKRRVEKSFIRNEVNNLLGKKYTQDTYAISCRQCRPRHHRLSHGTVIYR